MQKSGDFHTTSDQELISRVADIAARESSLAAARLGVVAEMDRRGLAMKLGHSSVARWYATGVRITDGMAKRHIALGYWLSTHTSVRDALDAGDIHAAHADTIADGVDLVRTADPTLDDDTTIVTTLLDVALDGLATQVARRAQELAHTAAADARARFDEAKRKQEQEQEQQRGDQNKNEDQKGDDENKDDEAPPKPPLPGRPPIPASENPALNKFDVHLLANGRGHVVGNFDKLTIEKLRAVISPLAAPRPVGGERDPRTSTQRNADAFGQIIDGYISGGKAPTQGGERANVNLVVTLKDLINGDSATAGKPTAEREWPFHLSWTGPISRNLAELIACDSNQNPVIVDGAGVPLAMGRAVRLVTPELRAAVVIRDKCCVKCGRPAQWCQVHHLVFWAHGGATDLGNLALVCGECHREIHYTDWELKIGDDGHPCLVPPAVIDPQRTPIPSFHRRRKHAA